MEPAQKSFFRDQFRSARAIALADAEGFHALFQVFELIGQQLIGKVGGLSDYKQRLSSLAADSPLAFDLPSHFPEYHNVFDTLFNEMQQARNDAVHQGAHARTLTEHAVELSIILEDALMANSSTVSQFMVRNVVEAKLWQPVSYVRHQMLTQAFSYLPILYENTWKLIPEFSIARFLRSASSSTERKRRLASLVSDSVAEGNVELLAAEVLHPNDLVAKAMEVISERPVLVVDQMRVDILAGLLTASDML